MSVRDYKKQITRRQSEGAGYLHREIPKGLNLDKVLCIRTVRGLRNDFTIAHNSRLYQIEKGLRSKEVTVERRPQRMCLGYMKHTSSADHPWNK